MTDNNGAYWVDWTTKAGVSTSDSFTTEKRAHDFFKARVRAGAVRAQAYYMPGDNMSREPYIIDEHPVPPEEDE